MTYTNHTTGRDSRDRHTAGSRLPTPGSSEKCSPSTHAIKQPAPTAAAPPAARTFFDPWNSSSTGHQRAQNRLSGSTSWRLSRSLKLSEQYRGGLTGGKRVADTVGAGSEDFGKDGRKANGGWEAGAKGLRIGGQKSLTEVWGASKASKKLLQEKMGTENVLLCVEEDCDFDQTSDLCPGSTSEKGVEPDEVAEANPDSRGPSSNTPEKQIFAGLCFYINGSTAPSISDHKLRHLLAAHGARHSIALGRRSVTHVILGMTNTQGGAGGGLAASKIQKEIGRTGGKAVRFITVEWYVQDPLDCESMPSFRATLR